MLSINLQGQLVFPYKCEFRDLERITNLLPPRLFARSAKNSFFFVKDEIYRTVTTRLILFVVWALYH